MSTPQERQSGWYWILPFHATFWYACYYDANYEAWHYRNSWGWADKDFDKIDDSVKLVRNKP